MEHSLNQVLEHPKIWRGDALAQAPRPGLATGFAVLDAELPGTGWPRAGLVEILPAQTGGGELSLLLPALAHLSAEELAWLVCVAPPHPFHGPALAAGGVALSRLLLTSAAGRDVGWACARALECDGVGAVLAWLPEVSDGLLRRLQSLAEEGQTTLFVFRPAACAQQASPAILRLRVAEDDGRLQVQILKRRGAPCTQALFLDIPRPARFRHVLASSVSTSLGARCLSTLAIA